MVPKKYMKIKQEDLAQVGSHSHDCTPLKTEYDACFNDWFANVFLKNKSKKNETPCAKLFEAYSECVQAALRKMDISTDDSMCANTMPPEPPPPDSANK